MSSKRIITSILAGTILEWYDFALFATMAPFISKLFFPVMDQSAALLASFAVFASGYVVRPVGAIVFGLLGDRFGRRYALSLTIFLMVAPSFLVCILPTYSSIGLYAPLILVMIRLLQGFAASGEYPGAMCYLSEVAPEGKKALWSSLSMVGVSGGILLGSLVNLILMSLLGEGEMLRWGWRIPFVLGLPLAVIAWFIRYRLQDSPVFTVMRSETKILQPVLSLWVEKRIELLVGIVFFALSTVNFYLSFVYVPAWLHVTKGLDSQTAMLSNVVATTVLILAIPCFSAMADRCSLNSFVRMGIVLILLGFYPAYYLLLSGSVLTVFLAQILISLMIAIFVAPLSAYVTGFFETMSRYTGIALCLNIGGSLFGSSAPFVAGYLVNKSGQITAPAVYVVLIAVLALLLQKRLEGANLSKGVHSSRILSESVS